MAGKRYATQEDMQNLIKEINHLANSMTEFARWHAYHTIKENPYMFNETQRELILSTSRGHITETLYMQLFKAYPLKPP